MANDVQKFLDNLTGLPTLWSLIKSKFVEKEAGKGLSTNDFTTVLKNKLDGIEAGAEVNQNAFSSVSDGTNTISASSKTDTINVAAGSNVQVSSNTTTKTLTISATDTTYSDATTSKSGLMSYGDKTKLNGIEQGAEVNQNAFSQVTAGGTAINASAKTDEVKFAAGDNVQISGNATTKTVTISATDTTYNNATQSTAGLMSAADKVALDNVVAASGEPNQNAFSYVKVGTITIEAETETDTLELAGGTNITLTPDATNDKVTIGTSAQVNVIESVKVNNSALAITSKAVNITVAEGSTNGAISVNGSDVSVHGLQSAAYAQTESTVANDSKLPTGAAVQSYVTGLGYQTATDVEDAIEAKISSTYTYKGSVATESLLPTTGQKVGDVYNIQSASSYGAAGMNVAWTGTAWDALGSNITIEAMTAADVEAICV